MQRCPSGLLAHGAATLSPLLLLALAWHLKHPLMFWLANWETPLLLAFALAGLVWQGRRGNRLPVALLLGVLGLLAWREAEFQQQRAAVLAAPASMQQVGRHFIVGFTDWAEVRQLAERGLIGGIYLARRNLRGRTLAEVTAEIATLQAARRQAGWPPLIVAGDQEGGPVSHLSPLLEAMPPLASLAGHASQAQHARHYGERQGLGLSKLGVNLNFGPVVDLRPAAPDNPRDRLTRISARAIAADPATVGSIAEGYVAGLASQGVRATLKHFPGLARVTQDTHLRAATIAEAPEALAGDWQPFRQLAGRPGTAIMLGHVTLSALDPEHAVSHSHAVVDGLLRGAWTYDGVLLTDDLNMGAVYDLGIGRVASEALAAGVDLILVSYDPRQFYRAAHAAARALARGEIREDVLQRSKRRLDAFQPRKASHDLKRGELATIAKPSRLPENRAES